MTNQHFAQLKTMLTKAPRLEPIMDYYFEHFAEAPDLLRQSRKGSEETREMLKALLSASAKAIGCSKVGDFRLLRIAGRPFSHGVFRVDGRPGTIFFFEDLSVGLASFLLPSGEPRYIRFATGTFPPGFLN